MKDFTEIAPYDVNENIFKMIDRDWMLVTAAKPDGSVNTMTASWGGAGILWNRPVAFVFIRPQRYTFGFVEVSPRLTLSFFDEKYRPALTLCGTKSGRDIDKIAAAGLSPVFDEKYGAPFFSEAKIALVCRKLYADMIAPENLLDTSVLSNYPHSDFHKMYICEIERVLTK